MSEVSDNIRKGFGESDDKRDEGLGIPEGIQRFPDIAYGPDQKWQVLDIYRPKNMEGKKLPVIVSVHGGGWVYGDKERYQYYCMDLAMRGFAVVNYTYRLAPEFKFPSALEDENLVFHFVLREAEQYGFDTRYVFGVGDSAGGHLLSLYSAFCSNKTLQNRFAFASPEGFRPTAIGLNCGAYRITINKEEPDLNTLLMMDVLENKGTDEELELMNPLPFVTEDFPPAFLMTCTGDFLHEDAILMMTRLMEKKVPHQFHFYGDKEHELGHVFHCNMRMEEARLCNDEEYNFFKGFVK